MVGNGGNGGWGGGGNPEPLSKTALPHFILAGPASWGWALWDHAFGEVLNKTDEVGNETDEVGNHISEVGFKILSAWGNKPQRGN